MEPVFMGHWWEIEGKFQQKPLCKSEKQRYQGRLRDVPRKHEALEYATLDKVQHRVHQKSVMTYRRILWCKTAEIC